MRRHTKTIMCILLASVSTEAELAAVLAHEIGHAVLHHNFSLFKACCHYASANSIGNLTGGLTGLLIKKMAKASLSEHSVSDEEDADMYAIQLLKASGYSHYGMILLLERFQKQSEMLDSRATFNKQKRYFKTHPSNKAPINQIQKSFAGKLMRRRFVGGQHQLYKIKKAVY
jgi:predicted Zn-dependent protease